MGSASRPLLQTKHLMSTECFTTVQAYRGHACCRVVSLPRSSKLQRSLSSIQRLRRSACRRLEYMHRRQMRSLGNGCELRQEVEENLARGLSKHCGLSFDISLGKPAQPSLSEPHCTTLQHFGRSRWDAEHEETDGENCSRK